MSRAIGLAALLILWETIGRLAPSPFLPPLSTVAAALFRLAASGEAAMHGEASLKNIILGFALACAVGLTLGVLVAQSGVAQRILMPLVDAMRPVAALTLFPLIITVLGIGSASKAFVIFWTAWPPILLNTAHALVTVDQVPIEAAQLDGAGRFAILRFVSIPLATPTILTGLRIGLSAGWISLVSAEMLGASEGLGYAILAYSQTFRFAEMYAVIILIAVLGLAMNTALGAVQHAYARWMLADGSKRWPSPFARFNERASGMAVEIGG